MSFPRIAFRGLFPPEFVKKTSWMSGPEFLWKEDVNLEVYEAGISENDPEVERVHSLATSTTKAVPTITERWKYFSS